MIITLSPLSHNPTTDIPADIYPCPLVHRYICMFSFIDPYIFALVVLLSVLMLNLLPADMPMFL